MPDPATGTIRVEVVYAEPGRVWARDLQLPAETTVAQAVAASRLAEERPDIRVAEDCLGVFGRRVKPQQVLRDGDRVEVYRPLIMDPKEARRRRARPRR